MRRAAKFFHELTAGDVMTCTALVLSHEMNVVAAVRLLLKQQVRVAPVTDSLGSCVGVLSVADILRWVADGGRVNEEGSAPTTCIWCDWQVVDVKASQSDEVRRFMMCDPLLVMSDMRLAEIAQVVIDRHSCPVVVVDEKLRPLGVVLRKDVRAALASTDHRPEEELLSVVATHGRVLHRRFVQRANTVWTDSAVEARVNASH